MFERMEWMWSRRAETWDWARGMGRIEELYGVFVSLDG
jgi:hypothetical protein